MAFLSMATPGTSSTANQVPKAALPPTLVLPGASPAWGKAAFHPGASQTGLAHGRGVLGHALSSQHYCFCASHVEEMGAGCSGKLDLTLG